jgi:translation initiation factor IF-3
LEHRDKVKVSLMFRGREMAYQGLGAAVLERVAELTADIANVEQAMRREGRRMFMVLAPK